MYFKKKYNVFILIFCCHKLIISKTVDLRVSRPLKTSILIKCFYCFFTKICLVRESFREIQFVKKLVKHNFYK